MTEMRKRRRLVLYVLAGLALAALGWVAYTRIDEWFETRGEEFAEVIPGVLFRSDQPHGRLRAMLQRTGIRTVVDLRLRNEDPAIFEKTAARCKAVGVDFMNIPVSAVVPDDLQVAAFLDVMRFGRKPVLVHCEHGKSRTGIMVAAYRVVVEGWSAEKAVEEMFADGYRSDPNHAVRLALLQRLQRDRQAWLDRTSSTTSTQG